jgi:hypothetical protein
MSLNIFNACLLAGLLLLSIGAFLIGAAAGFIASGVSLIALTIYVAKRFGVYAPKPLSAEEKDRAQGHADTGEVR